MQRVIRHVGRLIVYAELVVALAKISFYYVQKELNAVFFPKVFLVVFDYSRYVLDVSDSDLIVSFVPYAKVEYEMLVD
jgi:hypothetical protein